MVELESVKQICKFVGIKLHRKLSAGAQGTVYEAKHRSSNEKCCVKLVNLTNVNAKSQFVNEIEILHKIGKGNRNIISVKKAFYYGNTGYLILPLMSCDLLDYVLQFGKLCDNQAKLLFKQVVDAVEHIHKLNIAHFDIKPENILINTQSSFCHHHFCDCGNDESTTHHPSMVKPEIQSVRLIDFGHSVDCSSIYNFTSTASENNKIKIKKGGTDGYRAPEIYKSSFHSFKQQFSYKKADIWSLGVTLFVMMTGFFPFTEIQKSTASYSELEKKNVLIYYEDDSKFQVIDFLHIQKYIHSAECFDLLTKLLVDDPNDRITIKGIKEHPWLLSTSQ